MTSKLEDFVAHALAEASPGAAQIYNERLRQIIKEGWTHAHDDQYKIGVLSTAAGCYIVYGENPDYPEGTPPPEWPWDAEYWRPRDFARNHVRAGALIAAELDLIARRTQQGSH